MFFRQKRFNNKLIEVFSEKKNIIEKYLQANASQTGANVRSYNFIFPPFVVNFDQNKQTSKAKADAKMQIQYCSIHTGFLVNQNLANLYSGWLKLFKICTILTSNRFQ